MTTKNKTPPKVSGLIGSGKIGSVSPEMLGRMPSFDTTIPDGEGYYTLNPSNLLEPIVNIDVNKIQRSRFQNRLRSLGASISELAENIKMDGLNNPILVRPLDNGLFELISGETRLDAMIHIGLTQVPARIRTMTDTQAARSTVLDNMFHNSLSDYEIYKGFQILLNLGAVKSISGLSRDTPYSKTQVHRVMAFGKLPPEALEFFEAKPDLIGANIAEALADWCAKGQQTWVLKALARIRDGSMKQMRASSWIESQLHERIKPQKRVLTREGGKPYATMVRAGDTLRITAASAAEAEMLEKILMDILGKNFDSNQTVTEIVPTRDDL